MVKLDIITGFLGAGKTTLINRLLAEAYLGEKPALIENEFGDVSIDDSLIENQDIQVRLLSSGCVCCTLKGDFVDGITQVVEQYTPSRIIIEPTGLADPSDVLAACEEARKIASVEVNAFITVVNAKNLLPLLAVGGALFQKQIADTNLLMLNRTNMLCPDDLAETMSAIRLLNPNGVVLDQDKQLMDALAILTLAEDATMCWQGRGIQNCQHDQARGHNHDHEHEHNQAYSFESVSSLAFFPKRLFSAEELTGLFAVFADGRGGQVLRAKGFLKKAEGGYVHLEYVYGRGELLGSVYIGDPKFVIIGTGLDETTLARLLGEE